MSNKSTYVAPLSQNDTNLLTSTLRSISPTFHLILELAPVEIRQVLVVGYLIARLFDTLEDCNEVGSPLRVLLLEEGANTAWSKDTRELWLSKLERMSVDITEINQRNLVSRSRLIWGAYDGLEASARELIQANLSLMSRFMARYVATVSGGHASFVNMSDLINYIYSTTGLAVTLVTDAFLSYMSSGSARTRGAIAGKMYASSSAYVLASQIVNILKNIDDDRERGVSFIPISMLEDGPAARHDAVIYLTSVAIESLHLMTGYVVALKDEESNAPASHLAQLRSFFMAQILIMGAVLKKVLSNSTTTLKESLIAPSSEIARGLIDHARTVSVSTAASEKEISFLVQDLRKLLVLKSM